MKKKRLKPEAKATAAFGLLAFLFLSLTASFQVVVASTAGTSAEKTPSCHLNGDILTCQLRTLSDFNNSADTDTVLGAVEASRTQHLVLKCSEFNQESILRTNHFGYLPNLQKLSVDSCWLRKIPSLAFSGLSGLIGLSLINTGGGGGKRSTSNNLKSSSATQHHLQSVHILEIEVDAFTGLNNLRSLNLTGTHLWTLPEATFCGLNSLTELNLSNNFMQDLADLGFSSSSLTSCRIPLRTLDLSHNSLSSLPQKAFGQLRKLEQLNLASNNLNVIDDQALGGLGSLISLDLSHNQFVALPADLFQEAKYLQDLKLHNNTLSVLAPGLFHGLEHLLVLNLSRNEMGNEWITPQTFRDLLRLVALDLSYNRLATLDNGILNPLTSLQILDLSHNRIHHLRGNNFLSQVNLHSLKINHNTIDTIHSQAMAGLSVLSSLQLGHNRLQRLETDVFKNCTSLVDLSLPGNMFREVPNLALKEIKLLKTLDLGDNLLAHSLTISASSGGSFEGLSPHLYGLRLAGNGIRKLNGSIFRHVSQLQALNLADNELTLLDHGVFNLMPSLRMLRLDNNKLEELNGILAGQTELRFLNVSANQLQWFDYAFLPKSLEVLDISANQIEDIGNYYQLWGDFKLHHLNASSNLIKSIGYMSLLPSLQTVDLANNQISKVEAVTFANKTHLRQVDLRSNAVERLPLAALNLDQRPKSGLVLHHRRTEFLLGGNPFICDCEMEWLQKINTMPNHGGGGHHGVVGDLENIQCRLNSQYGLSGPVPLFQVPSSQFVCPYQAHCFALCMCCDFFACDCRMQCPEGCTCFHDSTWSANVIQCSRRGHTDIPPLIPMDATSILLDGNNFTGLLESQAFIGRKRVISLFLNASQIESVSSQTFNGLTELEVLHLEDNLIQTLHGHEFSNLTSLRELYLERNKLATINDMAFSALASLELLHLHDNLLNVYPVWQLGTSSLLPSLTALTISGNPWTCQCQFVHPFHQFAKEQPQLLADWVHVKCVADTNGGLIPMTSFSEGGQSSNATCSDALAVTYHTSSSGGGGSLTPGVGVGGAVVAGLPVNVLPIAVAIIAVAIVMAVASVLLFVFRTPLRVWLHSKYGIRVMNSNSGGGHFRGRGSGHHGTADKLYDAFVSYSVKDEDFVQQVLVPQLEHTDPAYKLCLQHRDLPTSSSISDSFPGVSQLCAKHLLVVSRAYLESEWTQIKYALQDHKKWHPILICLEELSVLDLAAAPEFNLFMKAGPVLKWSDAGFWNKLRFYLPDARLRQQIYQRNLKAGLRGLDSTQSSSASSASDHPKNQHLHHHGMEATPMTSACEAGWQYDGLLRGHTSSNGGSSSTSTRSTTMNGGKVGSGGCSSSGGLVTSEARLMSNPLEPFGRGEDLYQSVVNEHIYHTLEPPTTPPADAGDLTQRACAAPAFATPPTFLEAAAASSTVVDGTIYDSLCKLDVMLPNGQLVPATLVRNANGKVIPLVEVNSQTLPHQQPLRPTPTHHPLHPGESNGGLGGGGPRSPISTAQPQQHPRSFNKNRILMSSTANSSSAASASVSSPRSSSSSSNRHFV